MGGDDEHDDLGDDVGDHDVGELGQEEGHHGGRAHGQETHDEVLHCHQLMKHYTINYQATTNTE